jgi:hypothetical protein
MKIVMTILVRNEDDIIGENLKYHLNNGVDFFIITDHHSTDGTLDILHEYEARGVADVRVEKSNEHHQARWVTEMARKASEVYGADWVINNDADEFWIPKTGNLKDFFEAVNSNIYKIHAPRFDFFYRDFKDVKFYDVMIFREFVRRWTKCCHRATSNIVVEVGNHDANSETLSKTSSSTESIDLIVHHYPVRTLERYKKKMIEGTASVLSTPGIPSEMFFHWKQALQAIQDNTFESYIKSSMKTSDQINDDIRNYKLILDDTLQKFFFNNQR